MLRYMHCSERETVFCGIVKDLDSIGGVLKILRASLTPLKSQQDSNDLKSSLLGLFPLPAHLPFMK